MSPLKGRSVSLSKGQRVSLRKEDGVALTTVRMGLGWDAIKKRGMFGGRGADIDLDASAVMFADQHPVDVIFFNNLRSKDGSVQHLGDNRTGDGDGDDESIIVDLTGLPANVTAVVFIVTSYEGQTFEQVTNAFCRLVDNTTGAEMARYALGAGGAYTGMVMARVFRESGSWKLQAIGEGMQARRRWTRFRSWDGFSSPPERRGRGRSSALIDIADARHRVGSGSRDRKTATFFGADDRG